MEPPPAAEDTADEPVDETTAAAAEAGYDAAAREVQERTAAARKRDDDIIKWPDEEPPKKEVWEVAPLYDWEKEDRGYIFEERLEKATEMKNIGNEHFRASEWDLALRRYKRALYHSHIDEMQMFDLGDKHKADVHAVWVPCKLNLAFCIVRMTELGEPLEAGSLDLAEEAVNEVTKLQPTNGKAFFRRGQIALLQLDLPKAKEALDMAQKLSGNGGGLREAKARLNELLKEERKRDREMFGGKIQKESLVAKQAKDRARWAWLRSWSGIALLLSIFVGVLAVVVVRPLK